jgi:hypothetical protein
VEWCVTGYTLSHVSPHRVFVELELEHRGRHQVSDYPLPEQYVGPILEFLEATVGTEPKFRHRLKDLWNRWSHPS